MSINIWKVSTIGFAALSAALIGYAQIPSAEAGDVCKGQPHMKEARVRLREAKNQLEQADHNKKGWRVKALEHAVEAIREVDEGCEEADK